MRDLVIKPKQGQNPICADSMYKIEHDDATTPHLECVDVDATPAVRVMTTTPFASSSRLVAIRTGVRSSA
ncbi:MAG: hypothetical protein ACF8PN_07430 [Phycisphaerales bacterium]